MPILESELRTSVGSFFCYESDGVVLQISFGATPEPALVARGIVRSPEAAPRARALEEGFRTGDFAVPFSLELVRGAFDRRVLEALCAVGPGEVTTYGELAARVGSPGAARAVGGAMRRNPLPLVVPCHRVLPSTGKVGSYSAGGPAVKAWLLELEGRGGAVGSSGAPSSPSSPPPARGRGRGVTELSFSA